MFASNVSAHRILNLRLFLVWSLLVLAAVLRADAADSLEAGFNSPPASAQPHTWWHWMNGNVTREGITADLEAMKRVGIGGAQIFNASEGIPPGPAKFLSPEWRSLMQFAAQEANRLGLELCLHNCAGWSSSGGPWNTPEHAMQHVVTSELTVHGSTHFSGPVPQPPTRLDFYRDIAVFAFRTPDGEGVSMKSYAPKITGSVENIDGGRLTDGRAGTFVLLPAPEPNRPQYIQIEFPVPFTSRLVVLTPGTNMGDVRGAIRVSDDGQTFREVRSFALGRRPTRPLGLTLGESVSARFYRVEFTSAAAGVKEIGPAEIELNPRLRIENVDTKNGDTGGFVLSPPAAGEAVPSLVVKRAELIDLTGKLGAEGRLEWDAPAGDWTILRVGYTPTGRNNHPAPPEATGLECDKFSKAAFDAHWEGFVQKVLDDLGPLAGKGKAFNNVLIDSYEVGGQNWNANFREEFKRRRGYDPVPFLPAFTGRVVDSPEISERFLWDVRRTIADLFAENYYGRFVELCHARGLLASIEPYTGPFESLQSGAGADIPMGEFWVGDAPHRSVKLASSVGHIYGRTIIATESFTARPGVHGRWLDDPYAIKGVGDLVFCQGINRYIFHRYAMQPWTNRWPGMTMGQWGTHFDRTSTWWEQGKTWLEYVARCQFLLQQGRFVGDIAYFCGESAPVEMRMDGGEFAPPEGYDYDAINADVLLHQARIRNGRLVLNGGVSYRALVLPMDDRRLTPALLRQLRGFVADGLTIVGLPPQASPSLQNYPKCDEEVKRLTAEMWGTADAVENKLGKGKVTRANLQAVLRDLGTEPDFKFTKAGDAALAFIHRSTGNAEIYFVSNQRDRFDTVECSFRITGKLPELWNAETGSVEPAPVWREEGGRTVVPLALDPVGSVFVVFRSPARGDHVVSVQRIDPAVPGRSESPDLRILKAEYGAFIRQMDVTERVKSLVAGGARRIPVNNDMAGEDPASGVIKRLRVEYVMEGRRQAVEGYEPGTVELPAGAEVTKAVYGRFPGGGTNQMDVTQKIKALIAGGTRRIRADNEIARQDPAPNASKQLSITFRAHNEQWTAEVEEGEILEVPPGAEVEKAVYGRLRGSGVEPDRTIDLTDKLAGMIKAGELIVRVNNDLVGGDPVPFLPKELRVEYSLNGVVKRATTAENEQLVLPESRRTFGGPPAFALSAAAGRTWLRTSVPGAFALTWASGQTTEGKGPNLPAPIGLAGDWRLSFPPDRGAPAEVKLDQLISWPEHSEPGVRYFSGTATYEKQVDLPGEFLLPDREVWLDLGAVKNIAEVSLNGFPLATLWKPPFRVNLSRTGAAHAGNNRLEVKVTNLWPNRLIGDEQLPDDREWEGKRLRAWPQWVLDGKPSPTGRLTFTTWHHWTRTDPLVESGLLGPVKLFVVERVPMAAAR